MCCIVDKTVPVAIVRLELRGGKLDGGQVSRVNRNVDRRAANYGAGIERILRLLVVVMMSFRCRFSACWSFRNLNGAHGQFSDEAQKLDPRALKPI